MKQFFAAIVAVGLLAAAITADAQSYGVQTVNVTPATTVVGSTASNTPNAVVDCRKQSTVAFQIKQVFDGAGTDVMGYYFVRSVDGVSYETLKPTYVTAAGNGNTVVTTVTNIPTWGAGYIKLAYVTNAAAGTVSATNLSVKAAIKIAAP